MNFIFSLESHAPTFNTPAVCWKQINQIFYNGIQIKSGINVFFFSFILIHIFQVNSHMIWKVRNVRFINVCRKKIWIYNEVSLGKICCHRFVRTRTQKAASFSTFDNQTSFIWRTVLIDAFLILLIDKEETMTMFYKMYLWMKNNRFLENSMKIPISLPYWLYYYFIYQWL